MATALRDNQDQIKTGGAIVSDYVHPHSVNSGLPTEEIEPPKVGNELEVDEAVLEAFPIPDTRLEKAYHYGSSLWGKIAKLVTKLADGKSQNYFLKIIPFDNPGKQMCQGEFESLKAMYAVVPTFIPKVYQWGHLKKGPGYFLLAEFRDVGQQPPDPKKFTMRVAELHHNSRSPTDKFGFHVPTFHGNLPTYTGWEESWTVMYTKILATAMDIDWEKHGPWPEFKAVRELLLDKVIPRLLDPLSSQGRRIKPCLVHGDLWDENCAVDMANGEPFAFDPGSLYAHNEYETGYWRPPRHRLSNKAYTRSYKRYFPVSEPEDEWDDRNLLYSMRYNIGCSALIPSSGQRPVVLEDMKTLCRKYFPRELGEIEGLLNVSSANSITDGEELEDEDADIQASLKIVAAEMHVEKDYLMEELRETNGEEHARAEDTHNEETLDLKSNPEAMSMEPIQEAMNMEPIQEVHAKEAQEVKDKSDTAVEKNQTEGTQEPDYDFFWKTTGAV